MTKELIDSAMRDLTEETKSIYGEKLKEVLLFGSCARGDFVEGSDIDIMILVDVPAEEIRFEESKMRPIIHTLDRKYNYDLLFAPIVQSYEAFNYWLEVTPFYKNVRNEGIRYA